MGTPELFPGEHEVHEEAARAGWSPSVGNGWAAVFESPDDDGVTLRAYASFFEAGVRPAFLLVETLEGDPALCAVIPGSFGGPLPFCCVSHYRLH
jgi:hypothetical protein